MELGTSKKAQQEIQDKVEKLFKMISLDLQKKTYKNFVNLDKEGHIAFCSNSLFSLPRGVSSLSSGQPWILYWLLHALSLLDYSFSSEIISQVIAFINECKCQKSQVFAGGPFQSPHLAPTYSAICALISLNSPLGYEIIDREAIYEFILKMKRIDLPGSFRMHENGESDMRSAYCAICIASILNVLDEKVTENVPEYIASCQNYDGGFAAEPFGESHGGYTYCAIASIALLGKTQYVDLERALEWCLSRQMEVEGGFNGRPNKLVDSCYSFWIGAAIVILKKVMKIEEQLFDHQALQGYIMVACQSPMGLFDKPGSYPDFYHTAYSLAGLSLSQSPNLFKEAVLELPEIDPFVNVLQKNSDEARAFFKS